VKPQDALILLFLAAGEACARSQAEPRVASKEPLPSDVQSLTSLVASPAPQSLERTFEASGEFVSPVRSELAARLPGRVGKVFADEGTTVRKGQPLLELETEYLRLDVDKAVAEMARAEAMEEDARRDFARKKDLIEKGSVAQAVYDRSKASFEQAQASRASAAAALALARQRLADAVLVSPIDGSVLERRADVGQRIADNTVAFVLVQTAPLKLRFRLPERYLAQVKPGLPVHAKVDPYPGDIFEGHVAIVGQAVDPATRSILVEAEFPNRDGRLRSGLFARVVLNTAPSTPTR